MLTAAFVCSIVMAGEGIPFDGSLQPQFTPRQIAATSEATRAGLAKVAATEHGRKLIEYLKGGEFVIDVVEDRAENGIGRAPQPGIATLIAAGDHARTKAYEIILNPAFARPLPKEMDALPNQPAVPADTMALAWAGELLHIYFYAQGISLPHHPREDFQKEWLDLATELGMPTATHGDGDESTGWRRRAVVRVIGRN